MSSQDAMAECYEKPPLNLDETDVIGLVFDLTKRGKLDWKNTPHTNDDGVFKCTNNDVVIKLSSKGILYFDKYKFYDAYPILELLKEKNEPSEKTHARKLINQFFKGLI